MGDNKKVHLVTVDAPLKGPFHLLFEITVLGQTQFSILCTCGIGTEIISGVRIYKNCN